MNPHQRVAQRYIEARMFGLLSNHIGWQDLKRFKDQIQWMFKKGQHKVTSKVDRSGDKSISIEAQGSIATIKGFKSEGSGYSYRTLILEIDGSITKKTVDLQVVQMAVYKHFKEMGLRN